jgi:nucleotide-binding universal stress UspA family protein
MPRIIVGIDASERSQDALEFATRMARATGASLRLASAYPFNELVARGAAAARQDALHAGAEALLAEAADAVVGVDVITHALADTSPPAALHRLAEWTSGALVVVGSTGRGPVGRVLPGSTGERLLQGAPCSVAVVPYGYRQRASAEIRLIGVGHDGSEGSEVALRGALAAAKRLGAALRIVRVLEPAVAGAGAAAPEDAAWALEARAAELSTETPVEVVVVSGSAASELAAQTEDLDLLVLGARGYGPARAVLLGGVSRLVVRRAACPVVVQPRGVTSDLETLFAGTPAAAAAGAR